MEDGQTPCTDHATPPDGGMARAWDVLPHHHVTMLRMYTLRMDTLRMAGWPGGQHVPSTPSPWCGTGCAYHQHREGGMEGTYTSTTAWQHHGMDTISSHVMCRVYRWWWRGTYTSTPQHQTTTCKDGGEHLPSGHVGGWTGCGGARRTAGTYTSTSTPPVRATMLRGGIAPS